jgi:hypothetical protein
MTVKINADTSDGLKFVSDTSGTVDIQSNGTTKFTVGSTIDCQGNELVLDADADTSITCDTDDRIDFKTSGSDRMHLDSSGNLGIGTNAPESGLHLTDGTNVIAPQNSGRTATLIIEGGTETADLQFLTSQNYNHIFFGDAADANVGSIVYDHTNNSMQFSTNASERFRLDSSGKLYSGSDTPWTLGSGGSLAVSLGQGSFPFTAANPSNVVGIFNRMTTSGTVVEIKYNGNVVGQISTNGSSTTYGTSSDYRLKENVEYTFDATTELKKLKPCKFNFIGTSETIEGFVAHELSEVVPLAVTGTKDATKEEDVFDDEGVKTGTKTVPDYQSVDQSKLVPLLVKTIQELEERITALESE